VHNEGVCFVEVHLVKRVKEVREVRARGSALLCASLRSRSERRFISRIFIHQQWSRTSISRDTLSYRNYAALPADSTGKRGRPAGETRVARVKT